MLHLGHIVTREGILPDPSNVQAILDAAPPADVSAVKSFLGMTTHYSDFIQWYAAIGEPLFALLRKSVVFDWNAEQQQAFDTLKEKLASPPVLRRPDLSLPYLLHTDWSSTATGGVSAQIGTDGEEHPVAYGSRLLRGAERNYAATEGDCLAVVQFVEHWRSYMHGAEFVIEVDHWALKWMMTSPQSGKLARWALKLAEYNFTVRHRPGNMHCNADALSRLPIASDSAAFMATIQKRSTPVSGFDSPDRVEYADFADIQSDSLTDPDWEPLDLLGGDLGPVEPQELTDLLLSWSIHAIFAVVRTVTMSCFCVKCASEARTLTV